MQKLAQSLQEVAANRHATPVAAGGFEYDRPDLRIGFQGGFHPVEIVGWDRDAQRRDRVGHPGHARGVVRWIGRDGDGVVPAVEVALETEELWLTSEEPRQPQGHERGLGTAAGEADALGRRDELLNEPAPLDLEVVAGPVVGPLRHLFLDCTNHVIRRVAQKM